MRETRERDRTDDALAAFERIAAEDARTVERAGVVTPRELFDARARITWLERLEPQPSAALRLAVFAAHVGRHRLPRDARPPGRAAYLAWRREQKERQSELVGVVLGDLDFAATDIARVRALVERRALRTDPEAQLVEDCACLSFLEHEIEDFARGKDDAQLEDILRKTWAKMGERGRAAAAGIALSERLARLVARATTT